MGDAIIKPSLNRIETHLGVHQIEPKVMQILLLLCARPGHVVQRELLLKQVWEQTGDDYLLNRAISELRKIFADSTQNPKYIETIRKTGYRLLAPIRPVASAALVSSNSPADITQTNTSQTPEFERQDSHLKKSVQPNRNVNSRPLTVACISIVAVFSLFAVVELLTKPNEYSIADYQVYPVTSRVGREYEPALSPDGSRIAYVVDDQDGGSAVFVKMLRGENALKLSQGDANARFPKWMPNGQHIVYTNLSDSILRFISVSPMGGAQRTLYVDNAAVELRGLSVSPDGQQIIYSKRTTADTPLQIWLLSIADGEKRQLTFPKLGSLGDIDPLFAPDGQAVVFVRGSDEVTKDIYALNIDKGKIKRLTFDNRKVNGVTWSPDGSRLLFTSTRSGLYRLWSIDRNGSEPQPLALGLETVQRPTSTLGVEAIVFEDWKHRAKLMLVDLAREQQASPKPLLLSTRWDSSPSISPDGKTIVFASDRGGPYGIWLSDFDGENLHEWFNLGGAFIDNPSWSPDGSQVVFDASPDGKSQLYIIDKGAATPKVLSLGHYDNRRPFWSSDGKWIYFESNRNGKWQLYALRVGSDEVRALQVTGGQNLQESADGKWILFASDSDDGIWRCRKENSLRMDSEISGAQNTADCELLIPQMQRRDASNWVLAGQGVYFILRQKEDLPTLAFYSYSKRSIENIAMLADGFIGWGMVITPDESRLVFTELVPWDSDIRIARP